VSAIQYAVKLRCDYPGCESVGDALSESEPPAGWLSLAPFGPPAIEIRDPFGMYLRDFCSLHASVPLNKLAEVMLDKIAVPR
jgi:hypothetical protein